MTEVAGENGISPSWARRNWKWLLPTGCLGLVVVTAVWMVFIVTMILGGMKASGVYKDAVAAVTSSPKAIAVLGEPIEPGWWLMGSIDLSGSGGDADLAIPVSGPKGAGKLYVIGDKRAGVWTLKLLELEIEGREDRIDLLAGD